MATGYNPWSDEGYETPNIVWGIPIDNKNLGQVMRRKFEKYLPRYKNGAPRYRYWKNDDIYELHAPWKSLIYIKSADPNAGREKFQGEGIMGAWFDEEPKGENGEEIFKEVWARLEPGWPMRIWFTFTPLLGYSWSWRYLVNQSSEDFLEGTEDYRFDLWDCHVSRGGWMTDAMIHRIIRLYKPWELRARAHGEFTQAGGIPYFDPDKVDAFRDGARKGFRAHLALDALGNVKIQEASDGDFVIFERPERGERYACGTDMGGGVGRDFSIGSVWNVRTKAQVAVVRSQRLDAAKFTRERIVPITRYFNGAIVIPETNGQHGGIHLEVLRSSRQVRVARRRIWDVQRKAWTKQYGFDTNEKTRQWLFDICQAELEEATWKPQHRLLDEIRGTIDKDGRPDHQLGEHDDELVASMIALWYIRNLPRAEVVQSSVPKEFRQYYEDDSAERWAGDEDQLEMVS